jgi:hypothetical protein
MHSKRQPTEWAWNEGKVDRSAAHMRLVYGDADLPVALVANPVGHKGWRQEDIAAKTTSVNRAPVLTLWAAVVAQRLGFAEDEALTLGRAVAGLNAYSKSRRLGLLKTHEENPKKAREKRPSGDLSCCMRACHTRPQ